jgi:hypothetical protein
MGDNELKRERLNKDSKIWTLNRIYQQVSIFGHMKLRLNHDIWGNLTG